jgi:hypothetical protein
MPHAAFILQEYTDITVGVGSMVAVWAARLCVGIESACEQPLIANALNIRIIS